MFISLRESSASGFKKWSERQQQQHGDLSDPNASAVTLATVGPVAAALANDNSKLSS